MLFEILDVVRFRTFVLNAVSTRCRVHIFLISHRINLCWMEIWSFWFRSTFYSIHKRKHWIFLLSCFFSTASLKHEKQKRCVVSFCLLFLPRLPAAQIVHNTRLVRTKYTCSFLTLNSIFFASSYLLKLSGLPYANGMHPNPYPYRCLY